MWNNKTNKNKKIDSLLLGQPEETAAHEHALAWPNAMWPTLAPASASETDRGGPRDRETDKGKNRAATKLIAGDLSGETIDATVFALLVHT